MKYKKIKKYKKSSNNFLNLKYYYNFKKKNNYKKHFLQNIIILLILIIIAILVIYLISNKRNRNKYLNIENNAIILNHTNGRLNKDITEIIIEYQKEIKSEYNKIQELISSRNYNIKEHIENFIIKLGYFLKSDTNYADNKGISPIIIINNNSTLKNQYYSQFENIFTKYRNETELTDEYKNKFKQDILDGYSSIFNKKYTYIDTIIFSKNMNLGNALFVINDLIYYCEILGCKNIYLSKNYWFIKKPIYNEKLDMTISPLANNSYNTQSTVFIDENLSFDNSIKRFNNNFIPIRTYILKNEFLSNLKLIDLSINDLIINIRSGEDVFSNKFYSPGSYFQPPFCFYQTIIEQFNFSNIYIVSNGKENPVVGELLKLYKNIKYFHGTVEEDVAMVLSAKNLVLPTSSFTIELIKLSDNLQNVFYFDFIHQIDKKLWHFTKRHMKSLKFNKFIMNPTEEYTKIMNPWRKSKIQFNQMINEKCNKKFIIVPSDFA